MAAAPILPKAMFAGRRYAVLGLARSGRAAIKALLDAGAQVLAWDRNEDARREAGKLGGDGLTFAEPDAQRIAGFDGIVVSPGVPLNRHPIVQIAHDAGVPLMGDIELFAQARHTLPDHQVVAITGTNGKSTTSSLIHHLLEQAGIPTRLAGNIGNAVLADPPLPEGGVYVLELSSYQLDVTSSLDCEVAILLNITPDHLDRYDEGFAGYSASKAQLFRMQHRGTMAIVDRASLDEIAPVRRALDTRSPIVIEDVTLPGSQSDWPALQGPHNLCNASAAVAAVRRLGLEEADIVAGLASFPGLPHRMQMVCETGGVAFYNDSKATNPASAAPALAAFAPAGDRARVHWILGGLAKTETLDECEGFLGNVAAAYTIGEAGDMFARLLDGRVPVTRCELLGAAVRAASDAARDGDIVLLSPACASFDQFRDYEKRGYAFIQLVTAICDDRRDTRSTVR